MQSHTVGYTHFELGTLLCSVSLDGIYPQGVCETRRDSATGVTTAPVFSPIMLFFVKVKPAMVEVGISEHTDFEVITVMHQESPGLWLHSPGPAGHWYEPPFRQDVLTVILGVSSVCNSAPINRSIHNPYQQCQP